MKLLRLFLACFAIAWLPLTAMAQLPAGLNQVTSVEGITEYRLANGLQVLLVPDDSKPTTTVNVTYHVGARHESYGETGMAHLLEHLIFKGTPTTRNVLGELSKRGARANGTTSWDRTNYFASWSANEDTLRWYLSWQADAMVNSFIARADLDSEMTVVRNEMEIGENNATRILIEKVLASMYQWHNYGKGIIGARSDVENVDISRLQAFYRLYYQPDNATLIVAGKFDAAKTLQWIAEFFGPLKKPTRQLARTYTLDPPQDGERTVTLRRIGGTPTLLAGYHVTPGSHPDFAAVQVLAHALGDTPGGRLHKRLVQQQLAAGVFGFAWELAEPGPLMFGAVLPPGQDVERSRAAMLEVLDGVLREPITAEELERARTQYLNDWEKGFTDPEVVGVQLSAAIALGDWRLYFLERDQLQKVQLADVNRVAQQFLRRDNRTLGAYLPTAQPERAPAPATVDVAALVKDYRGRAQAAAVEAFDPTPANLDARTRSSTLPSGMKVALLPKGTRGNVVQARLRLNFGDLASLQGRNLHSGMLAQMIDKGGAGMSRQQIADAFDRLKAEVGFSGEEQALNVTISTRREHLAETLRLVGRLLREPALEAAALDEVRRQRLTALERDRTEPTAIVANQLRRHGNPYPRGDIRYASNFDELMQDTRAVTVEQLRQFHQRFYAATTAEFAAVGDIDVAAAQQALQAAFGDWKAPAAGALPFVRAPQPFVAIPPARTQIATPDKQNAVLRLVLPLPLKELDPDYAPLLLVNEMLSAGTGSRLWDRMREKDGLTYGVGSAILWDSFDGHSRYLVQASFAPGNRAKMEQALAEEFERVRKDGFTQAELDRIRNGVLQERRLNRAQDAVLANSLARNLHLGRSFAVSQQVDDALAKVTLEQANAALRKHLDPAKWALAIAGDFKSPQ